MTLRTTQGIESELQQLVCKIIIELYMFMPIVEITDQRHVQPGHTCVTLH